MGGGARFRVGIALSAIGEGLREAARDFGGASLRCVCLPLSPAGSGHPHHRFITPSNDRSIAYTSDARGKLGLDLRLTVLQLHSTHTGLAITYTLRHGRECTVNTLLVCRNPCYDTKWLSGPTAHACGLGLLQESTMPALGRGYPPSAI